MVKNVRFLNGLPNHLIRLFENWTKSVEKTNVLISGVQFSDGYCTLFNPMIPKNGQNSQVWESYYMLLIQLWLLL